MMPVFGAPTDQDGYSDAVVGHMVAAAA
jgi:hypothetical protein